ncbi:MAG: hypothetical protein HC930_14090 [Hydrococcus sp. SU_1_0]|nr:hypothetical protein [Hydrococcus sp. SU_1_0]
MENEQTTVEQQDDNSTPVEDSERKTGQESDQETRPGAAAEAPGADNDIAPGSPNQGTESR